MINKVSSGSIVQQCIDRVEFTGIDYTKFHNKN